MIVLDTNVISEMQGRTHSDRILNWLDAYDVETLFLTTIAVAEMRYGLELLDDGRRKTALVSDFNRIESEFAGRILGFASVRRIATACWLPSAERRGGRWKRRMP